MTLMGVIPARMSAQAASTEGTGPNQLASISTTTNTTTTVTAGSSFTVTVSLNDDGKDASGNPLRAPLPITATAAAPQVMTITMPANSPFSLSVSATGADIINGADAVATAQALVTTGSVVAGINMSSTSANNTMVITMSSATADNQITDGLTVTLRITPTKAGSYNLTLTSKDQQSGFGTSYSANVATTVSAQTTVASLGVTGPSAATDSLGFTVGVVAYDIYNNQVNTTTTGTPMNISFTVGNPPGTAVAANQFVRVSDAASANGTSGFSANLTAGAYSDNFKITTKITNVFVTASLATVLPGVSFSATSAFSVSGVLNNFLITFFPTNTARAGESMVITVTARDNQSSTIALASGKTVALASPLFPATSVTFNGTSSVMTTTVTPNLVGTSVVTASIGSPEFVTNTSTTALFPDSSGTLTVLNGKPNKILVSPAVTQTAAGSFFQITLTVQDSNGNTVVDTTNAAYSATTGYFTLASSTAGSVLPLTYSLGTPASPGVFVPLVALYANGSQSLVATWSYSPVVTGASTAISVSTNAGATRFAVSPTVNTARVGSPFQVTITAQDDGRNTVTTYTGTVLLTSKTGAITPTSVSFSGTNGVKVVDITLGTITANEVITATDSANPAVRGASPSINVYGDISNFNVVASGLSGGGTGTIKAGQGFTLTLTARDALNSTVSNFVGTVTLGSNNTISPSSASFAAGNSGIVILTNVQLFALGNNYITVTAASFTATGSLASPVSVTIGDLNNFAVTVATTTLTSGTGAVFSIQARDPGNNNRTTDNGQVTLVPYLGVNANGAALYGSATYSGSNFMAPNYVTLTNGAASITVTLLTPGAQTLRVYNGKVVSYTTLPTIMGSSASLTVNGSATFPLTDISTLGAASQSAIQELYNLGIVAGTSASTYSPAANVTRDQMAAFMARSYDAVAPTPAAAAVITFSDVLTASFAYTSIQKIVSLGITIGCQTTPPLYCPSGNVTREHMALFLARLYKSLAGADAALVSVPFTDINTLTIASQDAVRRIYGLGVTTGTTSTTYTPSGFVTREQMALFITRLIRLFP